MKDPTPEGPPVALVTGASSGIGRLTARRLAGQGFRVFGTSRSGALPEADQAVTMLPLDVDRAESVEACMGQLWTRTARLDVLVNNAGRATVGACEETSADEAMALFQTNFFGMMRVVSAVLPAMRARGGGRIVNVGSVSGFVAPPFHGVYAASKHAVAGYSEALRQEVRTFGVLVSLVEPDAHRTGIQMRHPRGELPVYDAHRTRVERMIRRQIDTGDDPERIVDAIVTAATSRSPRFRFRVGKTARLAALGKRFLPESVFDAVLLREFGPAKEA
jgi:NAD(P)-dependent dehydrogenase (short-subunit alcohol dehydrogenase family)